MLVKKLVITTQEETIKIKKATALSSKEVKKYLTLEDSKHYTYWWTRSHGIYYYQAAYVEGKDNPDNIGGRMGVDNFWCVRPGLIIDITNTNWEIGDIFIFGNKKFKIVSETLAFIYKDDIGKCQFNSDGENNEYINSDLEKYIDKWFYSHLDEEIYAAP